MSAQSRPTSGGSRPGRGPARQALAAAVRELADAAEGSLGEIGKRMRPQRARQRISEWQTGARLPQLEELKAFARACIPAGRPEGERRRLGYRLHILHAAAQAERSSAPGQASDTASPATGAGTGSGAAPVVVGSVLPRAARSVADWDRFHLGVHRPISIRQPGGPDSLPPHPTYVERDHDRELDTHLEDPSRSLMIVLVGGSSTGKTRTACEALRRARPGWPLLCPVTAAELLDTAAGNADAQPRVLWLDEAQRFLLGPDGPEVAAGLRRMLISEAGPTIVMSTMWPGYWSALTRIRE
jgi:hypothetical protein